MLATDDATIIELPALERGLEPDEVDARLAAIALAVEQTDSGSAREVGPAAAGCERRWLRRSSLRAF